MQKLFLKGLGITLLLNLLIKPLTIFAVDVKVQNALGNDAYGIFQTTLSTTFLLSMLLDMGMTNFMTRTIAQYPHLIQKYSNRLLTYRLILIAIYVCCTFLIYLPYGTSHQTFWLLFALILHQINTITVFYIRSFTAGLLKFGLDALLSVIERGIYLIFGVVILYTSLFGVISMGMFVGIMVGSSFLALLIGTIIYIKLIGVPKFHWDIVFFKFTFRQTFWYASLVVLMMITYKLDALTINYLHPKNAASQVGYYTQSQRLLDACWMFGVLFGTVLLPIFSKQLKTGESVGKILTISFNVLVSGALLIAFLSVSFREDLFPKIYPNTSHFTTDSWMFHGFAFVSMCFTIVFGTLLTANNSLKRLNLYAFISLVTVILVNLFTVPKWGAPGAALGLFVSQSVLGLAQYLDVKYIMKQDMAKHTWGRMLGLCVLLGTVYLLKKEGILSDFLFLIVILTTWFSYVILSKLIDLKQLLGVLVRKGED